MSEQVNIVAAVLYGIWGLNLVLPFILGITTGLVFFWSRGKINLSLASRYQAFKWRNDKYDWVNGDPHCWIVRLALVEGLFGLFAASLLHCSGIEIAIFVGVLSLILLVPRFIMDISKGLKMNHKTGDLEEINSLKKRLEELEAKEEK